ncbi:MAG: hybrid sensor histidine kinase/response regulator [Trichodesmium sp. St16_bin4-tuft]|nr:hybrid sensor histidine kinase/response regulator [Trichodesmium sp. MAG_R01]MDE5072171.1 hybrid sensor histidine kinase/response regulator [Trichodesmium sp. St5_bin8]MDE5079812.1 hybrid sensor histidine kinase/response regulator [Trichodesmium sp. St2_bin6]MDE5090220.1 hybrid sensor histidine kinase/response regulator [Trichodesmium sp. St18_bin3_1_1]MDE5099125.1 hybrid sensor histidine kinase/response regulator [Trichodesmium sp. St16_bin4-tuft]MDE5102692.1 hybrid sensor histidine kinase
MTKKLNSEYILVVDDVQANLKVIVKTLTNEGYKVSTAISSDQALKQISYDIPDLILLDIQTSGIDGLEICQRLKENPEMKDIPVILMAVPSNIKNIVKGLTLGAVDYITIPFQAIEVLSKVKNHIHLQQLKKNLEKEVAKKTYELTQALEQLKASQVKPIKSEEMLVAGELMAGVANEFNHPIGSIYSNSSYLETYMKNILQHLFLYQKNYPNPVAEIIQSAEDIDLDFIIGDFPNIITSIKTSSERIKYLSSYLQKFRKQSVITVHKSIDSALLILKHRLKANQYRSGIKVVKKYGDLPKMKCLTGQLIQVFMNIIYNAIDEIDEFGNKVGFSNCKFEPKIVINTLISHDKKEVIVTIKDNGIGMSEEVKRTVFDKLSNTRYVAKGTSLSLSIAHQIVVKNYHGKLCCESTINKGSKFILQLPITEMSKNMR